MTVSLVVSNDSINKITPPYEITHTIFKLVTSISEKIGERNKTAYKLTPSHSKKSR